MRLSMFVWVNFALAVIAVIFVLVNIYWLVVGDSAGDPTMLVLWIIVSVSNYLSWRSVK